MARRISRIFENLEWGTEEFNQAIEAVAFTKGDAIVRTYVDDEQVIEQMRKEFWFILDFEYHQLGGRHEMRDRDIYAIWITMPARYQWELMSISEKMELLYQEKLVPESKRPNAVVPAEKRISKVFA